MTSDSSDAADREWPDYSPLYEVIVDADGMLALDFSVRVGARPYLTFEDGEWRGVSVGPFDHTEDGKTIITTKELDIDGERVTEMLESARLVEVHSTQNTPLEEFEPWVYGGVGEPGQPVEDYEPNTDSEETDSDETGVEVYVLTDADGELIPGEIHESSDEAMDSRAYQMANHEDGDDVTIKTLD